MGSIKFVKEPGYTENLFWIFGIYFNQKNLALPIAGYERSAEDMKYFEEVLKDYLPISEDLRLFFYMPQSKVSFMDAYYTRPYKDKRLDLEYNLNIVLEKLADHEQVAANLLRFYFREVSEETRQECLVSLKCAKQLIKYSRYGVEIKNALYEFLIDPVPLIERLISELKAKSALLEAQYEKQQGEIVELQNQLSYEKIISDLKQVPNEGKDFGRYEEIYVSVGIIARQVISVKPAEDAVAIVIGLDYLDFIEQIKKKELPVELDSFGNAVSEKNRIKILEFIQRKGEATQKEVEKELGLTANNAYYHLMLMHQANMLKVGVKGRATSYRIHKEYMTAVMQEIEKYTK